MISTYPQTWEGSLLSLAIEGRRAVAAPAIRAIADTDLLTRAYAHCESIAREYSHSFYLATALMPAEKRRAIRALYAFCRVSDDIVDCGDANAKQRLAIWRRKALSSNPPRDDLVAVAWADTRRRYRIPQRYIEQLIEGVARDLDQKRYRTFDELAAYAYGVASTVGLMSMHIIGFKSAAAIPSAIKLGVALQVTNILRDVAEDWRAGRLYLPSEEMAAFGLDESNIAAGHVDERWRAFMRFQIERNRRLYAEALPGIALLDPDGRLAVAAAGELYRGILDDIEMHDYDVFARRAHVGTWGKLSRLPGIWWRNR